MIQCGHDLLIKISVSDMYMCYICKKLFETKKDNGRCKRKHKMLIKKHKHAFDSDVYYCNECKREFLATEVE